MTSIRNFDGEIFLCTACGQPCYEDAGVAPDYGPCLMHFSEQWDDVYCHMHPLAAEKIVMEWDELSLETLKEQYPDTHPDHARPARRPA